MQVRRADHSDMDILKSLRLSYIEEDMGMPEEPVRSIMEKQMAAYMEAHLGVDFFAFLAFIGEEAAGTAFLCVQEKPANPNFPTGRTGTVMNVLVKKEYRGQGIGTKLMEELIQTAKGLSLSYLELLATKEGKGLYERVGFQAHESRYISMRYAL